MNQNLPTDPPYFEKYLHLVELVAGVRYLAFDHTLDPDDAMRRIRDALGEYDGVFDDPDDGDE